MAGLRTGDLKEPFPEELNRVLTDQISDLLFTHSHDADENLAREGVDREKVHLVGNVMIDSLFKQLARAKESEIRRDLGDGEARLRVRGPGQPPAAR